LRDEATFGRLVLLPDEVGRTAFSLTQNRFVDFVERAKYEVNRPLTSNNRICNFTAKSLIRRTYQPIPAQINLDSAL
jgi:hypothetical protein